jgi:hypothetical protein
MGTMQWNQQGDMKYESHCPTYLKKDGLKKANFSESPKSTPEYKVCLNDNAV